MNKKTHILILLFCIMAGLSSCVLDAGREPEPEATSYLVVRNGTLTRVLMPGGETPPADGALDNAIITLRIMAFDPVTGQIKSNKRYNASNGQEIKHPIDPDTYNFVFIANEPGDQTTFNTLETMTSYSALAGMDFSEASVNSTGYIPMSQEINNVEVLPNGGGANVAGDPEYTPGNTHPILHLHLSRLATRVDILLESEADLDGFFKGVTFSNVAASVPAVGESNASAARNVTRTFTLADDGGYFTKITTFTAEQQARNITWAYRITRFILPYSNFAPADDDTKGVTFTVDMENRYSPYCKLEKNPDDFTLPRDVALLLEGKVQMPLQLNIQASPWGEEGGEWNVQDRYLNVSETVVDITDFNGARIMFSSNMPQVHVLPEIAVTQTFPTVQSATRLTEESFNDLVVKAADEPIVDGTKTTYKTTRFSYTYDSATGKGSGYMDILLDEYNISQSDFASYPNGRKATFYLVLSAGEDRFGSKLQREIKINTAQYGFRENVYANWYSNQPYRFAGAFFRENETGERIVTGQIHRVDGELGEWNVEVDPEYVNDIVLSTTPSFDPHVGTDNPGNAEKYPVVPNEYREETGTNVSGRGRMYYRIAWKTPNPSTETDDEGKKKPRYAVLTCRFPSNTTGTRSSHKIYLRQGEAADYVMLNGDTFDVKDDVGETGIILPRNKSVKIPPFNITDPLMYNKGPEYTNYYETTPVGGGVFVDFPSQAGAFYQWVVPTTSDQVRRAFHPTLPITGAMPGWLQGNSAYPTYGGSPIWADSAGEAAPEGPSNVSAEWQPHYEPGYGALFETCPPGYRRPTDGYTDRISFNGIYPNYLVTETPSNTGQVGNYYNPATRLFYLPGGRRDGRAEVAESEWRQSLWVNPGAGETVSGTGSYTVSDTDIQVIRERNAPPTLRDVDIFLLHGFYADGFFDRRPMKVAGGFVGVAMDTPGAAFRGTVFFNNDTKASTFFPAGGRRINTNGSLNGVGTTGFYWSSSSSPTGATGSGYHNRNAWGLEINYSGPGHTHSVTAYGYMIRCVKDE